MDTRAQTIEHETVQLQEDELIAKVDYPVPTPSTPPLFFKEDSLIQAKGSPSDLI